MLYYFTILEFRWKVEEKPSKTSVTTSYIPTMKLHITKRIPSDYKFWCHPWYILLSTTDQTTLNGCSLFCVYPTSLLELTIHPSTNPSLGRVKDNRESFYSEARKCR